MDITQIKIFPVEEEKLKAFVSIVFDHCFMINDIKVIEGQDGLFLSMPSRRKRSGEFKDVAHPLNNETRRRIEVEVLEEYRKIVDDPTPRRPDRKPSPEEPRPPATRPAPEPAGAATAKSEPPRHEGLRDDPTVATGDETEPRKAPEPKEPSAEPKESREPEGAEEATEPESGAEEKEVDEAESPDALGEVQERHLRDSFWQVT